jgi:aspartate-semialdehyde dehydrogenase
MGFTVAIMGATGAVGQEMLLTLEQRAFPVGKLRLLASERSEGRFLVYRGKRCAVETLCEKSFEGVDIVLASAGASISKEFAPIAAKAGAVVIDNTSYFRMEKDVPLVVPEVNPDRAADCFKAPKNPRIIANPNCSTIQMVVALNPIRKAVGIKRLVITTFQAVSGAGNPAVNELMSQVHGLIEGEDMESMHCDVFAHPIAYNALPHIDSFLENGYTKEEMKMANETHKIFEDDSIGVTATTVRVPVLRGHSESVNVETLKPITPEECRKLIAAAPGCTVVDDPSKNEYPLAIYCEGKDDTFVGRIRKDESIANGINMWIVSDNLRKGAALNAVQIAELLVQRGLVKSAE